MRSKSFDSMKRIIGTEFLVESLITGLNRFFRSAVFVFVQIERVSFRSKLLHYVIEFLHPMNAPNAGNRGGLFLVVLVTFPDLQVFAGFAQKEDFAVLGIRGAWKQDKNGLFLFDAAEVKQVGVRMQGQRAIGGGGQNVVGVGEGDCPNRKPFRQPFSMLGE